MTQLKPRSKSTHLKSVESVAQDSHISPWLSRIIYSIGSHVVLPLFFGNIQIEGQENIPLHDPVIIAPTHRSRWDALVVPYALGRLVSGRDLRFMVSADEVKGIQGWIIRHMGGFPVNTERPQISSIHHSIDLLKTNQEMLVIFPEGGIFNDEQIHPLKRGVALIALQTETSLCDESANTSITTQDLSTPQNSVVASPLSVKILPVRVHYSQPYPTWGTNIKVNIGVPLAVKDYLGKSLRKSSQDLTAAMQTSLQKL
ncbi:MAG: 1-acyl-sn-glycerol-3-phosphate acyltransferase [Cyanobacteria bacterium J06621_8]